MDCTFNGKARLRATIPSLAGKEKTDLAISFRITLQPSGTCSIEVGDFRLDPVLVDIPVLGEYGLTVSLVERATGIWSKAKCALKFKAKLRFDLPVAPALLTLVFDTAANCQLPGTAVPYQGHAADPASGAMALAARDRFAGNSLVQGEDCIVKLDGVLTPKPWA